MNNYHALIRSTTWTMADSTTRYSAELDELSRKHLKRELAPICGIDFTSNDFLGFSEAPAIRDAVLKAVEDGMPLGAGGSRLLRGNHRIHEELETMATEFFGSEKALYFGSGYSANYALLTTLPKRHDFIVYDALSHASIREGVFASLAKSVRAPHNDVDAVADALSNWRKTGSASARAWIVVESLYSMDGDCAPLDDLLDIADRYGATLIVDEAHATGVWGANGHGFTEPFEGHSNLVALHTCGKALGVAGGLVCASSELIEFLVNKSRPFIYSTAPPPINALAVHAALQLLVREPQRRSLLHERIALANREFESRFHRKGSGTQIIPFVIGDEKPTRDIADLMQRAGFDLRAIRPPTVPIGTARLRISITLHVSNQQIQSMFDALETVMPKIHCDNQLRA